MDRQERLEKENKTLGPKSCENIDTLSIKFLDIIQHNLLHCKFLPTMELKRQRNQKCITKNIYLLIILLLHTSKLQLKNVFPMLIVQEEMSPPR